GVGTRALVEHRLYAVLELVRFQPGEELALVQVVRDLAGSEVRELVGALEIVDRDDLGDALAVQALDQAGTDEPGGAGDDVMMHLRSAHLPKSSSRVAT